MVNLPCALVAGTLEPVLDKLKMLMCRKVFSQNFSTKSLLKAVTAKIISIYKKLR